MHIINNTLIACSLSAMTLSAYAADTVDLKVTGKIIPPSCTPVIDGGGVVDFGTISTRDLSLTADSVLPDVKKTTLTISCPTPIRVAFTVTDMRKDSIPAVLDDNYGKTSLQPYGNPIGGGGAEMNNFGLGKTSSGAPIGVYGISLTRVDVVGAGGISDYIANSGDNGQNWGMNNGSVSVRNNNSTLYSAALTNGTTNKTQDLASAAEFKYYLSINAIVNDMTEMPVKDEINLDGLATFTMVYI